MVFSTRVQVSPGLQVGFTTTAAGNLAFHVTGEAVGPGEPAQDPASLDPEAQARLRDQVAGRRRALDEVMGVPAGRTEYLDQVHSARVVPARGRGWDAVGSAPVQADAQVSPAGLDPLAIMVADCLPVVFVSQRAGASERSDQWDGPTAVAHAGRRGLLDGVLEATVEQMHAAGASREPGRIQAWIGPAICGRCYEVPEQMFQESVRALPQVAAQTSWGTPALDLPAGAEHVLSSLGVRVHRTGECTREDERFYSHRRAPGAGRLAGLVWRTET